MKNDSENISTLTQEEFLNNNCLTEEQFKKANISWEELQKIGLAHRDNIPALSETAGLISSILQQGEKVHSVRWRIKDPQHLMSKIIRKKSEDENNKKYNAISKDNYTGVVTDLIGIRVLHLFKEDWETIHNYLDSKWEFKEAPIVYIREGDASDINIVNGIEKTHPAGYRSVHYIITTRLLKHDIYTEIQVRTIFEEAWSEIDHHVRYPNFKDNKVLNYFLLTFNRFAGSADEMGTFVLSLKNELKESIKLSHKISEIEEENETYLAKIDELLNSLKAGEKVTLKTENELKNVRAKLDALQNKKDNLYASSLFQLSESKPSSSTASILPHTRSITVGDVVNTNSKRLTNSILINNDLSTVSVPSSNKTGSPKK